MSKLNIDQRTIGDLFRDKKSDFLIPDYQRPYAWDVDECAVLWDDIHNFAIPDDNYQNFDPDEEYFLGPIVTFKNSDGKQEIIDGQQRLTTLMLLLRAFYERFTNMSDEYSVKTREMISRCIWKTDEFGTPDLSRPKIESKVATDGDAREFLEILRSGSTDNMDSRYARNYDYFAEKIDGFLNKYPTYFPYLPTRIMNNCILLPIEAESQDTALRIFSTLNNRGKPLSDADIFKAQFYRYYDQKGMKDDFIVRWRNLEETCHRIFPSSTGNPMDEIFSRYMYYERSKANNKSTTTEALRKFYSASNFSILKNESTLDNMIDLAGFWESVYDQDSDRFSDEVLKRLYILYNAPNGMWTFISTVYYLVNRDENGLLDDAKFVAFLNRIIAFIWAFSISNPGVNALRGPLYSEMVSIIDGKEVTFSDYRFDSTRLRNSLGNYTFTNGKPITRSMLVWWMLNNDSDQSTPNIDTKFEIEHIYSRKRSENDRAISSTQLEMLGNKAMLEKRINIRASDYRFSDKRQYYLGSGRRAGTVNRELVQMCGWNNFTESDIERRNSDIVCRFLEYLDANGLLMKD